MTHLLPSTDDNGAVVPMPFNFTYWGVPVAAGSRVNVSSNGFPSFDGTVNGSLQGLIPDPAWKAAAIGETWTPGDSVNMGIGQGFVQVTPLQIAEMMAAVANGGTLLRPQIVHHVAPPGGAPLTPFAPIPTGTLPVSAEQLAIIQDGLDGAINLPKGTAHGVFPTFEIPVLGKTGTAEDPAVGAPHAWFAGYTQAHRPDKPDIVMVVMIENVGEGSQFAAPLFKRMAEIYFLGRAYSLLPWEQEFSGTPTATPAP